MVSQKIRNWAKWIIGVESEFQLKTKKALSIKWQRSSKEVESLYSTNTFGNLAWYSQFPTLYPPENFSLAEFQDCWTEYDWGRSITGDARILAGLLQLRDRDGNIKDQESATESIRKELISHEGKVRYEWLMILWSIHREKIRQRCKDDAYLADVRQRQIA